MYIQFFWTLSFCYLDLILQSTFECLGSYNVEYSLIGFSILYNSAIAGAISVFCFFPISFVINQFCIKKKKNNFFCLVFRLTFFFVFTNVRLTGIHIYFPMHIYVDISCFKPLENNNTIAVTNIGEKKIVCLYVPYNVWRTGLIINSYENIFSTYLLEIYFISIFIDGASIKNCFTERLYIFFNYPGNSQFQLFIDFNI